MIGFVCDYKRSDEVWLILSMLTSLEKLGHDVQVMPLGRSHRVHPRLDYHVTKQRVFDDWAALCNWVVFSQMPPIEVLQAAKQSGAKTALLLQWSFLRPGDSAALGHVDLALCPSRAVHKHFSAAPGFPPVAYVPASVNMPPIRNDNAVDATRLAVLWYLDGSQPLVQDASFIDAIRALIVDQRVYLTVLYSNRLSSQYLNELLKLQLEADGRVELMRDPPWEQQFLTIADHDLVVWPSVIENTGLTGVIAATAGTPCIAYDYPVVSDVIRDEVNGILVPCELSFTEMRVPVVASRDGVFLDNMRRLLDAPALLQHMRTTAAYGLDSRNADFKTAIENIFSYHCAAR